MRETMRFMSKRTWIAVGFGSLLALACGSDVSLVGNGNGSGSGGTSTVDESCYERCIDIGGTPTECTAECSSAGSSTLDERCYDECMDDGGSSTECTEACTVSSSSGSGANGSSGGGNFDPELTERFCFECLEQNASACPSEYEACADDLACTVLKKCPFECLDDEECIQQCNTIVPSGVPLLTELIECMVCNGPPCLADCADSIMFDYCE